MNVIVKEIMTEILKGNKTYLGEIRLPSLQTAGTSFQKETYAKITAERIYQDNKFFLNNYHN